MEKRNVIVSIYAPAVYFISVSCQLCSYIIVLRIYILFNKIRKNSDWFQIKVNIVNIIMVVTFHLRRNGKASLYMQKNNNTPCPLNAL